MKTTSTLLLLLLLLSADVVFAQTNHRVYAPGHVYIYSEGKNKYGLCTADYKHVTDAVYDAISQGGFFLIAYKKREPQDSLAHLFDVYDAWGKYLVSCDRAALATDTTLLLFDYNGRYGDVYGFFYMNSSLFYTFGLPKATMLYSSGALKEKPFRVGKLLLRAEGCWETTDERNKKGVYNARMDSVLIPTRYDTIREIYPNYLLGWNSESDYVVTDAVGKRYTLPPTVYQAWKISSTGSFYNMQDKLLGRVSITDSFDVAMLNSAPPDSIPVK
jgi:hypothetical protein